MTITGLGKGLYKINPYLTVITKDDNPQRIIYLSFHDNCVIYDFKTKEYNLSNCDKYLSNDMEDIADLIDEYNYENNNQTIDLRECTSGLPKSDNPFKKYTDHLAETLQSKNVAYGDSFTKSVDDYGIKVIGIRLSDKYNRVKHLVNHGLLKQNDESLEDTLLDMAGYSILALKYLKEHKKELENGKDD